VQPASHRRASHKSNRHAVFTKLSPVRGSIWSAPQLRSIGHREMPRAPTHHRQTLLLQRTMREQVSQRGAEVGIP
jgi:hypothetical protein